MLIFCSVAGAMDPASSIKYAQSILNKGCYTEALAHFHEAASNAKSDILRSKALFFIGQTYGFYLKDPSTALGYYDDLLAQYPDTPAASDALYNSAIVQFDTGNYETAHSLFSCYMQRYPAGMRFRSAAAWIEIVEPFLERQAPVIEPQQVVQKMPAENSARPEESTVQTDAETILRVLLRENTRRVRVSSQKTIVVCDAKTDKLIYSGWGPLVFYGKGRRLYLNGRPIASGECTVSSAVTAMWLDRRCYRGDFRISATPYGMKVINRVALEPYLYSVVPGEMPGNWPRQALMAQAVAARTYALYMQDKNRLLDYDLEATTASQVYGGYLSETQRTCRAVDATRGQVMVYDGQLIIACFHSNSGGHTEDPRNVWDAPMPYLRGIPDKYSEVAGGDTWEYYVSYADVKQCLNRYGFKVGRVEKIKAEGLSPSGRHKKMLVISDNGIVPLSGTDFRSTVGETKLKSTLFQMVPHADGILFRGRGYGHGVGMSQRGACQMARNGMNYKDILRHYYQNIQIISLHHTAGKTVGRQRPLT